MEQKRFYYSQSSVYGWCVYDRQTYAPAYEACVEYLPPVKIGENGMMAVSPVLLGSEYQAINICHKLNVAYRRELLGK